MSISFDELIAEARKVTTKVAIGGTEYVIGVPSADALRALATADMNNDTKGALMSLLGDDAGPAAIEASRNAPYTATRKFVEEIMRELGMGTSPS